NHYYVYDLTPTTIINVGESLPPLLEERGGGHSSQFEFILSSQPLLCLRPHPYYADKCGRVFIPSPGGEGWRSFSFSRGGSTLYRIKS
ncbi:MAG TPA: hypothetical protein VGD26_02815, partial [Chitinophagaceae bacterium]